MKRFRLFATVILAALALMAASNQPTTSRVKAAAPTTCGAYAYGHTTAGDGQITQCPDDGLTNWRAADHYFIGGTRDTCPVDGAPLVLGHTVGGN